MIGGSITYFVLFQFRLFMDDVVRASEEFSFLRFGYQDTGFSFRWQTHCPVYFNVRNDKQFFFFLYLYVHQEPDNAKCFQIPIQSRNVARSCLGSWCSL